MILLYLESFGNPRKFSEIARRVGRTKPIVAVKAGRSVSGARAASSHTGALAGSDKVVDALFEQAGVIRTETLEEMFDVAALLAHQPIPKGKRVAILTNAGGPGILAADACEADGLELPVLSEATRAELRRFLPPAASVTNPVDMLASAPAEHFARALAIILTDENVDSVLTIFIPPLVTEPDAVAAAIASAAPEANGKPILGIFMRAEGAPAALASIPSYAFPESAARALARVTHYGAWRAKAVGDVLSFPDVRRDDLRTLVDEVLTRGGGWLTTDESRRLLAAAGIASAPTSSVASADEAVAEADRMGYPVALKAVGPDAPAQDRAQRRPPEPDRRCLGTRGRTPVRVGVRRRAVGHGGAAHGAGRRRDAGRRDRGPDLRPDRRLRQRRRARRAARRHRVPAASADRP